MGPFEQSGLGPRDRDAVASALARDPALAAELEQIAVVLDPGVRDRFWRALARELPRRERPAAAILPALEAALDQSS